MGLFSRAFGAALTHTGNTITQAAAISGLSQPSVSRIVSGDSLPDPANLSKLLLAIDPGDRAHCLRQYLLEHTPDDFHGRLILTFGEAEEAPIPPPDELSKALCFLEKEATQDKHLERVLIELALSFSGNDRHNIHNVLPLDEHARNAGTIAQMRSKNVSLLKPKKTK